MLQHFAIKLFAYTGQCKDLKQGKIVWFCSNVAKSTCQHL